MNAFSPYVEEKPAPERGLVLTRPPHRVERLMRLALRFVGGGLLALAALVFVAAGRLDGGDAAIGVGFGAVMLIGGVLTLWWMARSGGVRRIELGDDRLVLHRAGFAGIERTVTIERPSIRALRAVSRGEGRAAVWQVWIVSSAAEVELGTFSRSGDSRRSVSALAERFGVEAT